MHIARFSKRSGRAGVRWLTTAKAEEKTVATISKSTFTRIFAIQPIRPAADFAGVQALDADSKSLVG